MPLRRVTMVFDDTDNPKLRRLLDAIASPENDRRWEKVKGATWNLESTGSREVVDLTIETLHQ